MADSYVCSGAIMKCSMGTSQAKLTVLPSRTVFLTGQPMANISDHLSMVNLAPFGRCRSLGFPATASATAANHGTLTPMPCIHNTPFPWMGGKNDYIVKGDPALLKSSTCQCMWGGTISIIDDGQHGEGTQWVVYKRKDYFSPLDFAKDYTDKEITEELLRNEGFSFEKAKEYMDALRIERKNIASKFYMDNNPQMKNEDIEDEIAGIDLDKPVIIDSISNGSFYQWISPSLIEQDGDVVAQMRLGSYYTEDPNAQTDDLSVAPAFTLTIQKEHEKEQHIVGTGTKIHLLLQYNFNPPKKCLRSTALKKCDNWSNTPEMISPKEVKKLRKKMEQDGKSEEEIKKTLKKLFAFPTTGGASQIYLPLNANEKEELLANAVET